MTINFTMKPLWLICSVLTGMIGYTINGSLGWAIINGIFWIITWMIWLINHQVNMDIIRQTFAFFLV